MSRYDLTGRTAAGADHPWATFGESAAPFAAVYRGTRNTTAYVVLLCLTGTSAGVALLRRRWGWLLALAGITLVSLSMRRNIAPAAMILAPLSMIALTDGWRGLGKRPAGRRRPTLWRRLGPLAGPAVAVATVALSAWWTIAVVTQRFYLSERRAWRFGLGPSRMSLPLDAADWINAQKPKGRIFCDYDVSSNLMFFTRPHRDVPLLTNSWAYPPYVMEWVVQCTAAHRQFQPVVREYGIGTVVLRSAPSTRPLISKLSRNPRWALVSIDAMQAIFVARDGPDSDLAAGQEITKEGFDVEAFIARVGAADPVPAYALHSAATLLLQVGWGDHAVTIWRRAVRTPPESFDALRELATCLSIRGDGRLRLMHAHAGQGDAGQAQRYRDQARGDFAEAEKHFRRALEIRPGDKDVRIKLQAVRTRLQALGPRQLALPGRP